MRLPLRKLPIRSSNSSALGSSTPVRPVSPVFVVMQLIFYSTPGFAVIILVGEVLLLVVSKKGERWREAHLVKNFEKETKEAIKMSTLLKRRGSDATMCAQ